MVLIQALFQQHPLYVKIRQNDITGNNNESKEKNTGGQATATDGEEIYQQNCTGCHGKDLSGGSAPSLKEVGGKYKAFPWQPVQFCW